MFVIDCSEFPPQDYLRTADGVIAVYATLTESQVVIRALGGIIRPASVLKQADKFRVIV